MIDKHLLSWVKTLYDVRCEDEWIKRVMKPIMELKRETEDSISIRTYYKYLNEFSENDDFTIKFSELANLALEYIGEADMQGMAVFPNEILALLDFLYWAAMSQDVKE